MEMMLQTQNLCKYFRKQKAVNNVSLNIEKKQIYGLLGPNGAGKSTTLKMLTGMMKPTAGKIYFDGKLWDRKDLSKIGALIENPPIYENLSARENLKVRQLLLGTDENRIDEVLQIVSPVSYTHLDVYKRQILNSAAARERYRREKTVSALFFTAVSVVLLLLLVLRLFLRR